MFLEIRVFSWSPPRGRRLRSLMMDAEEMWWISNRGPFCSCCDVEDRVVLWGLQAASWENFLEKSLHLYLNSDDRCLSVTYLCVRLCWTWAGRNHTEWGHCSSAKEDVTVYGVRQIIKQSTTKCWSIASIIYLCTCSFSKSFFARLSSSLWGKEAHVQGAH